MAARKSAINLLPKTEFEKSFWGRFLKWSLSAGRYTIILTELVVIVAFLSRFKLDKDLLDLNDKIEGQKAILEATYNIETNFRNTQSRIDQAKKLLDNELDATGQIDQIIKILPPTVTLKQLSVDAQEIAFIAITSYEPDLGTLINQARANKNWKAVNVVGITSTPQQGVEVSVTISI